MAHKPSLLPVLKTFGLDPKEFAQFLGVTHGFVAGGAASSAYFGKSLYDDQDLDIWIPIPVSSGCSAIYKTSPNYDSASYCSLLRTYIFNYFTKNQRRPNQRILLSLSLDQISKKYSGVYTKITTKDIAQYTQSNMSNMISCIDTYENTWTGRRIQVIYTYNKTADEVLSNYDFDVCQFYTDGTDDFLVRPFKTSATNLANMRQGHAKILTNTEDIQTEYQQQRLEERVAKYECRGYTFTWASSGIPYQAPQLPPAPTESFWQDFVFYTQDFSENMTKEQMRDVFFNMLNDAGCHFEGSDTDGTLKLLVNYYTRQFKFDSDAGDNQQYTWRFTWDAYNAKENFYIYSMILQNLY
jgi:hypothetical protein